MARDFSPITFFQRVPNALLGRYFREKHDVLHDVAFDALEENRIAAEAVYQAFSGLPEGNQAEIEAECQDIDAMANQAGVTALIDEATDFHQNATFPEAINQINSFHGKVMWTFLEYPNYWAGATSILHAENIPDAYWKKRNDLPHVTPHVQPEDSDRLADGLSHYFHSKEGRGRHCKVDVFRKRGREHFFAYLSDFGQSDFEWEGNTLSPRARHPAFEIIFVYTQTEGSLDIYAPHNTKYVDDLQQIFADTILKLNELDEFAGDDRVYNLDKLADRAFVFRPPLDSGIKTVLVRRLRFSLFGAGKRKVAVEAHTDQNSKAVYDLMDRLRLPPFHVTQAEITVIFLAPVPGTRTRTRTFRISYPNWCNLHHEGRDLVIRKMLVASGIELMELETAKENSDS